MAMGDDILDRERAEDERRRRRKHRSYPDKLSDIIEERHQSRPRRHRVGEAEDSRQHRGSQPEGNNRRREEPRARISWGRAHGQRPHHEGVPYLGTTKSALRPYAESRNRTREMHRRQSLSASSTSNSEPPETPFTPPDDDKSPRKKRLGERHPVSGRLPVRGLNKVYSNISESEEYYEHLTPGQRQIRTGHSARGAHGTSFTVEVRSDIGSLSSESDVESDSEAARLDPTQGSGSAAQDKTMAGALPPGDAPLPRPEAGEQPMITKSRPKSDTSLLDLLIRPTHMRGRSRENSTSARRHRHSRHATAAHEREISQPVDDLRSSSPTTPSGSGMSPVPQAKVECLTCCDEVLVSKASKLECDHIMCEACLKRVFEMSVTDPQLMPPKCCSNKHIPLKFVAPLLDNKFKVLWNQKFREFTTRDRLYCPKRGCGAWVMPKDIKLDRSVGRRYGICGSCNTKVCKKCNMKWHGKKDCTNDEETRQLVDLAAKEGWQRCYNCKAMVQLAEGCNHMKCRCNAEFCMICGAKWKTCDCPWFNTPPDDFDGGVGVPFPPYPFIRRHIRFRAGQQNRPPVPFLVPEPPPRAGFAAEILARRLQEQEDEELARRIALDELPPPPALPPPLAPASDNDLLLRGWGLAGRFGANEALNAAIHVLTALGNEPGLQRAATERAQPPIVRRNAAVAAWTRQRSDRDKDSRSSRRRPSRTDSTIRNEESSDLGHRYQGPRDERWYTSSARVSVRGERGESRRRERTPRQDVGDGEFHRPSVAAMAGLGAAGRTRRDRVGGWLEYVAGGPNNLH